MITTTFRTFRLILHIIRGLMAALMLALRDAAGQSVQRDRAMQSWTQGLLNILRVHVHHVGSPPDHHAALITSNHVSWLDIPVLGAACPAHFLSKAEVRTWPVIGWLARQAGTLFIRRGSGQSGAIRHAMRQKLAAGRSVIFFPEGTTTRGSSVQRFHPRLFQAAIDAGRPVQPVAIHYRRRGEPDSLAPFVDDEGFVPHLWRLLQAEPTDVYVHWGPLLSPGASAHQLAHDAQQFCATTIARLTWIPHEGHLELWMEGLA